MFHVNLEASFKWRNVLRRFFYRTEKNKLIVKCPTHSASTCSVFASCVSMLLSTLGCVLHSQKKKSIFLKDFFCKDNRCWNLVLICFDFVGLIGSAICPDVAWGAVSFPGCASLLLKCKDKMFEQHREELKGCKEHYIRWCRGNWGNSACSYFHIDVIHCKIPGMLNLESTHFVQNKTSLIWGCVFWKTCCVLELIWKPLSIQGSGASRCSVT